MSQTIDERKVQDAWKVVDNALRLIARARQIMAPLVCDARLAGIQRSLESRRAAPSFVVGVEPPEGHRLWEVTPAMAGHLAPLPIRHGVFVLPLHGQHSCESKGTLRMVCDVADCEPETAAWLCHPDSRVFAPRLEGRLLESILELPEAVDRAFSAYGALREAAHAVRELDQIARAELAAIDSALAPPDPGELAADARPSSGELEYLLKLDAVLSEHIQRERDLAKDREQLSRNYKLQSISLTEPLVSADLVDRQDERKKSAFSVIFGKATTFVTLRDEAINRLVDNVEKVALEAVRKRVGRIAQSIERLGKGKLQQVLGMRFGSAGEVESATEEARRRRMQEAIGVAGREFQFKIEKLGALNRLMRARMEVAGLLMVVSLAITAFGEGMDPGTRAFLLKFTLTVAVVITIYSYISARSSEQERREDELIRLRGLLRKPVAEAVGRAYVDAMVLVTQQLEAVRAEVKRRVEQLQNKKSARANVEPPLSSVKLVALRAQIARALGGMGGIASTESQVSAQLSLGSPIRVALDPFLKEGAK